MSSHGANVTGDTSTAASRHSDSGPEPGGATEYDDLIAQRDRNALLARLPSDEDRRLVPRLEPLALQTRDVLEGAGEALEAVYFPLDAVASVVDNVDSGSVVEITTIGNEGVVGMHAFLGAAASPYNTYCQVPGRVLRLPVAELRTFMAADGCPAPALPPLHPGHHRAVVAQRGVPSAPPGRYSARPGGCS